MSGWTITRMEDGTPKERRYHRFEDVLASGVSLCQVQSLPGGVNPVGQATCPDDGIVLLWSDGFLSREVRPLPGLLPARLEWLHVLSCLKATPHEEDGAAETQWRTILALDLTRSGAGMAPPRWTARDALHGSPARQTMLGTQTLVEVRGSQRSCVYLGHDLPSERQLQEDTGMRLVRLTHAANDEGGGPVIALPPGMDETELRLTLAALQRVYDLDVTMPFMSDLAQHDYAEALRDFYGCTLLPDTTAAQTELDLYWNWERVACALPQEEVWPRLRPGVRLALLQATGVVYSHADHEDLFRELREAFVDYHADLCVRLDTHPDEHPGWHPTWRELTRRDQWPEELQERFSDDTAPQPHDAPAPQRHQP